MTSVKPVLHVPDAIAAGLESGRLVREGGVVRDCATGRIVALLREAGDGGGPGFALSDVLTLLDAEDGGSLADAVKTILEAVRACQAEGRAAVIHAEADLVGRAQAALRALQHDAAAGRCNRWIEHCDRLLEVFHCSLQAADRMLQDREVLERHGRGALEAFTVASLAGRALLWVAYTWGDPREAVQVARDVNHDVELTASRVEAALGKPSSLLWMTGDHAVLRARAKKTASRWRQVDEVLALPPQEQRALLEAGATAVEVLPAVNGVGVKHR